MKKLRILLIFMFLVLIPISAFTQDWGAAFGKGLENFLITVTLFVFSLINIGICIRYFKNKMILFHVVSLGVYCCYLKYLQGLINVKYVSIDFGISSIRAFEFMILFIIAGGFLNFISVIKWIALTLKEKKQDVI